MLNFNKTYSSRCFIRRLSLPYSLFAHCCDRASGQRQRIILWWQCPQNVIKVKLLTTSGGLQMDTVQFLNILARAEIVTSSTRKQQDKTERNSKHSFICISYRSTKCHLLLCLWWKWFFTALSVQNWAQEKDSSRPLAASLGHRELCMDLHSRD